MLHRAVERGISAVLTLQLALFVTPVLPCDIRRLEHGISWNVQSPSRMMSAYADATTPYRRIRVADLSDTDLAYPLIAAYLQRPSLAESVQEFAVQLTSDPYLRGLADLHNPGADRPPLLVSDTDHAAILSHVGALGLPLETTQRMKAALDWWRETAKARPSKPWQDPLDCLLGRRSSGAEDEQDKRLYDDFASTAAALILSLCPNIATFHLGDVYNELLVEYLLRSNYGLTPLPALQNLQHVEHYTDDSASMYDMYDGVELLGHFRYFHRLPRVRSVSMEGVMDYQVDRETFPPKTSKGIRKLHFGHSDISDEMLATLVRIPTALEELSVSLGGLFHPDSGSAMADPGLLGRALEQHKDTLQVLDLDFGDTLSGWMYQASRESRSYSEPDDDDEYYDDVEEDEYSALDEADSDGPLRPTDVKKPQDHDGTILVVRGYSALKKLSVNVEVIVGPTKQEFIDKDTPIQIKLARQPPFRLIDALPQSLEYLCLYGYEKGAVPDLDEHVAELMAKKDERLPKLREIRGVDAVERVVEIEGAWGGDAVQWERPDQDLSWLEA